MHSANDSWEERLSERVELRLSLESVYQQYGNHVYRWSLQYCAGDTAAAKDVSQEVFLRLLKVLHRLRAGHDLGGWLRRVTANVALKRLRRERSVWTRAWRALRLTPVEESPPAEAALLVHEEGQTLLAALQRLPVNERMVASMRFLDDLSQVEIARTLSFSEGYVSKLLARAKRRLRDAQWEVDDETA